MPSAASRPARPCGTGPACSDRIYHRGAARCKCPTYVHRTPPCQGGCPSGTDIRGSLAIARGQTGRAVEGMAWQEYAFQRMMEANPFPSVMGRVCPAPCEDGCNRNEVDDFVGINGVEQYVGDWAIEHNLAAPAAGADTAKRVAVIGGGPAGLAAAYFLRRNGHAVTLFEAHDKLGGMMRFGIPGYRTPRDKLDAEIGRILALGVEARLNTKVGRDIGIDELEASYDAIFWAIGAQKGRGLPVPGWGTENCLTGIEFLDVFNRGWVFSTAKRIVVVGGGDTSIDVASVSRRLGHITHQAHHDQPDTAAFGYTAHDVAGVIRREGVKAVLTSLFPVEQMTAAEREREDAKREGIEIKGGVMPLEILRDKAGHAVAIKMCQCTVKGATPVPVEGTEFHIPCDMVVSAIGQMADLAEGLERLDSGRSAIAIDAVYKVRGTQNTSPAATLCARICSPPPSAMPVSPRKPSRISWMAIRSKRPKVDVHHFNLLEELHARKLDPEPYAHGQSRGTSSANFAIHNYEDRSSSQIVPHTALFKGHFPYTARNERAERPVSASQVVGDFNERMVGFTEQQARTEGMRCMSCGLCFECDACLIYCPQKAIDRVPKKERAAGRYVATDYTKCVGCHICQDVCPPATSRWASGSKAIC